MVIATAPSTSATGIKIGELATRSGMPVKTLRYYEDLGLLPAVGRTKGGYRLFGEESLRRLVFIRRLKALGLSLEDIQHNLSVHDSGKLPCRDIQQQLEVQIQRVDERIEELRLLKEELLGLLDSWQSDPVRDPSVICPNLHV